MGAIVKTRDADSTLAELPEDTRCGFGWFRPWWLQRLASKKAYVLLFGVVGGSYLALSAYHVATISTVEKRFKMSSRTTGIVRSATDISSASVCLLIGYLGSRGGHKPRWVAFGTLLVALSCFANLLPHALYGAGQDALRLAADGAATVANLTGVKTAHMCHASPPSADVTDDACVESASTLTAAAIFFCARLVVGVGTSMYWTLGVAYLDDNVLKTKTPLLLSTVWAIRMLGPTAGFLLASYSLGLFIQTNIQPAVGVNDPRWLGAWWLGWIPLGCFLLLLAFLLAMFPLSLPRAAKRRTSAQAPPPSERSLADLKATLRRLGRNHANTLNMFSGVFFMCGYIGYFTFMPKYIETQFRQSAARASLVTGSLGLMSMGAGVLLSGPVMTRFRPRARLVAAYNVAVECLEVGARIGYIYIGCSAQDLHGSWAVTPAGNRRWNLTAACNAPCECAATINYSPVCSADGSTTFYSACHAACSAAVRLANGTTVYEGCDCTGDAGLGYKGACAVDCANNFLAFVAIECLVRFLSATGRAGNTIIQFRCVLPEDKSVAIGIAEMLLSVFAHIPGPILYGWILDSSCLVWGEICGRSGNCWLYDGNSLRYGLNLTVAGFMLCGTLLDVGVWYFVKDLRIYDEDYEAQPDACADDAEAIEPLQPLRPD